MKRRPKPAPSGGLPVPGLKLPVPGLKLSLPGRMLTVATRRGGGWIFSRKTICYSHKKYSLYLYDKN